MSILTKARSMPTKLRYKLIISFCLMSLLPLAIGLSILNVLFDYADLKSPGNIVVLGFVTLSTLIFSFLGYKITHQLIEPIHQKTCIAQQEFLERSSSDSSQVDELRDLAMSLKKISQDAHELLEKVSKFSLKDKLTGLYNVSYIRERLNEEISRAIHYQHPCSFAYLALNRFEEFCLEHSDEQVDEVLKKVAQTIGYYLSEFDRASRTNASEFAIIFPDKNKKKAIQIIEKIKVDIQKYFLEIDKKPSVLSLSVGISENPIDGANADELFVKAQDRVRAAQSKGPNDVEAFA